jgi:hypothetical protein
LDPVEGDSFMKTLLDNRGDELLTWLASKGVGSAIDAPEATGKAASKTPVLKVPK